MKKILLFLSCIFIFSAYKIISEKNSAIVEQEEGINIFIKSKPVAEYEYLGSVKKGMALSGQPEEMFNSMVKKCKKEFPSANGLIFTSIGLDKADCVKFK